MKKSFLSSFQSLFLKDLKKGDEDRYYAVLCAGRKERLPLLALYRFNLELNRIAFYPDCDPFIVKIRLQFWREALGGFLQDEQSFEEKDPISEKPPLLSFMQQVLSLDETQVLFLNALIDAKESLVSHHRLQTIEELQTLYEATEGQLESYIANCFYGSDPDSAQAVGISWAFITLLFAQPAFRRLFPVNATSEMLAQTGAMYQQYITAPLPKPQAVLQTLTLRRLKRLEKANYDLSNSLIQSPDPLKSWSLLRKGLF